MYIFETNWDYVCVLVGIYKVSVALKENHSVSRLILALTMEKENVVTHKAEFVINDDDFQLSHPRIDTQKRYGLSFCIIIVVFVRAYVTLCVISTKKVVFFSFHSTSAWATFYFLSVVFCIYWNCKFKFADKKNYVKLRFTGTHCTIQHINVMKMLVNNKINTNNVVDHSNDERSTLPNLFTKMDEKNEMELR